MERKTTDDEDRLQFLEYYTSGYPKELVVSCRKLPTVEGYRMVIKLLREQFRKEHQIANAYMKKAYAGTAIQPEDTKALWVFAIFLVGVAR